jgi:ABC-type amino acid transport substrate-binding protein
MKGRKIPRLPVLVLALLLIVVLPSLSRALPENRTYVIGWEESPPDEVATTSGEPTGFGVELVREAAKRRAIRLQWVLHPESSEAALLTKAVDLWPIMVITEDRKRLFHLTDSYEEEEFGLFVDAKSAYTRADDLKQQRIATDGVPFDAKLLREHFPRSTHLLMHSLTDAVKSVCDGEAQAFFEDQTAVFSFLLSNPRNPPCPDTSLRMLPVPPIKVQLGIGATRESAAAADAIREEIGVMSSDGSLRRIAGVWSHNASQEVASLLVLQQAKSRLRWYRIGFMAVAGLLVFASWSAAGYRRQRMKSQAYCRALGQAERNVRLATDSLSEMVVASTCIDV